MVGNVAPKSSRYSGCHKNSIKFNLTQNKANTNTENRGVEVIKIPWKDVEQCWIKLNSVRGINTGFELRVVLLGEVYKKGFL